jgi:hypothetical protein
MEGIVKHLLVLLALLVPSIFMPQIASAANAEATIEKEIELRSKAQRTIDWVDSHRDAVREASGVSLVEDLGNGKFKVRRDSSKGVFIWISKETIEKKPDGSFVFKSTMVESIEGGMEYSKSEVTIKDIRGGVSINIKTSTGINNRRVTSGQLRIDTNVHLNRVKRLLEENIR